MRKPSRMEVALGTSTFALAAILGVTLMRGASSGGEGTAANPADDGRATAGASKDPYAPADPGRCPDKGDPNPDPVAIEKYCKPSADPEASSGRPATKADPSLLGPSGDTCAAEMDGNNVTITPDMAGETAEVTNNGPGCFRVYEVGNGSTVSNVYPGEGFTATCIDIDNTQLRVVAAGTRNGAVDYMSGTLIMAQEGGFGMRQC